MILKYNDYSLQHDVAIILEQLSIIKNSDELLLEKSQLMGLIKKGLNLAQFAGSISGKAEAILSDPKAILDYIGAGKISKSDFSELVAAYMGMYVELDATTLHDFKDNFKVINKIISKNTDVTPLTRKQQITKSEKEEAKAQANFDRQKKKNKRERDKLAALELKKQKK